MPRNLTRYYGAGDLHFLTASCYRRQPFLGTAQRRDLFLAVLERIRRRYRLVVLGYVVMPEHFHLLVTEPQRANLSIAIQALKLGFVRNGCPPGCSSRNRTHMAGAVLRLQRLDRTQTNSEAALYASESGEAGIGGIARAMGVEQFSLLYARRGGTGAGVRYGYFDYACSTNRKLSSGLGPRSRNTGETWGTRLEFTDPP